MGYGLGVLRLTVTSTAIVTNGFIITGRRGSANLYVRIYVPRRLREASAKAPEIWRSLGTPDLREAKELAPGFVDRELDKLRAKAGAAPADETFSEPSRDAIEEAAREVYHALVQSDEDERIHDSDAIPRGGKKSAKAYRKYAREVRRAIARGDFGHADLGSWTHHFGFEFMPGSVLEREFHQLLCKAEAEAAERAAERDKGDLLSKPSETVFRVPAAPTGAPTAALEPARTSAPPLLTLWPRYEQHRADSLRAATLTNRGKVVMLFAKHVGVGRPSDSITKAEAREFRDLLYRMPTRAAQRRQFKGKTIGQIVEMNERLGCDVISALTRNKIISELSTFHSWLVREGYVSDNIWSNLAPSLPKRTNSYPPFTVAQLQLLFDSPLFTGCAGRTKIRSILTPGCIEIRDWRYWLPLLAAFSGARQSELAQLEIADIRRADGIDYINITGTGGDKAKAVKSAAAERNVPLHSTLVAMGFLKYVAGLRTAGHSRVFPELSRDTNGQFGNVSRFYQKVFKTLPFELEEGVRRLTFHSFRHSVVDELRRKRAEHEFQPLIGHEAKTTTRGYGSRPTYDLERRLELIEEITYPGLDLSHLL